MRTICSGCHQRTVRVLAQHQSQSKDPPAKKYCLRATVRLIDREARPIGVFTGYDTAVTIGDDVEQACELFRTSVLSDEFQCDSAEVVLHHECPVEITNEIYFARILELD